MVWIWSAVAVAAVDVDERLTVDDPAVHGELALFPVRDRQAPRTPEGDYATLEEGLRDETLAIAELDASGSVPRLRASNTGQRTVLLLAGEVITGGKQDRVVVADTLVPPGAAVEFAVNCVEQGRWSAGSQGLSFGFGGKAELGLKQTVQIEANQGSTWGAVAELNTRKQQKFGAAELAPATGTYRASLQTEEVRAEADAALAALLPALGGDEVVGVVVAVDGEIRGTELFGHPGLFARHRESLVRGFALDAASDLEDERPGVPPTAEAAAFVRDSLAAPEQLQRDGADAADWAFEAEEVEGKALKSKGSGETIHRSSYKK